MQHRWRYKKMFKPGLKAFKTLIVLNIAVITYGQTSNTFYSDKKKGQIYVSWGWNRGFYSKSNIHLRGADYDFTLYKVKAHDRPTPFSYHNYLKFNRLTIPQTNFRLGYFIKDNIAVSLGFDHMKYVMDQDQVVNMKGTIDHPGLYKGVYNGDKTLTSDFLRFEHTNGLNYINIEGEQFAKLYHSKSNKLIVSWFKGAGIGFLFPRSDVKLMDYDRNDEFHVAGYGINLTAGLQSTFFKHFFIKIENKCGFINMPDINLHKKGIFGRGKQSFWFDELDGMIGGSFSFGHKKKTKKNIENYNK
ncbi:MAG TPA: hypothetical protein PKC82_07195 [Chitinophagaceae bacterium]|jgi:hypothetical protein|nr:hypothetical protein [Chitinophagaceae bacterium]HMW66698.1 hypothetical protein [Chitinophagaceae bacterium]HNF37972.1 hypothetical protein [Chitinophagaceae bacterium]HNO00463.1 hypothetical protein [Chitinophagaceae bacterium]